MRFGKVNLLLLFLIASFFCQSQTLSAQTLPVQNNEISEQTNEENLVHYGDVLDVDVLGSYEYDWRGKLTPEGFLNGIDYVENPIYGLCKSEDEIARAVEAGYSKLLKNPKVSVKIIDRSDRPVTQLLGAVKLPQRFQIRRPVLLNELLILSGGLTEKASGEVQIFRPANLSCIKKTKTDEADKNAEAATSGETEIIKIKVADLLAGKKEANPNIYNGDLITILVSEPIYVIGGVENPKQIPVRPAMTLTRAVDSAGGVSKNGREDDVTVFRREGRETKVIAANLSQIKNHQAEDLILMAYDIVEIGQKGGSKRKYPPIIQEKESETKNISNLPLIIIE